MKKSDLLPILFIISFIGFLVWVGLSVPDDISGTQPNESVLESTMLEYTIIDGMPCLRDQGYRQGGITCDWTQWDGETYIDENGVEQIRIKQ